MVQNNNITLIILDTEEPECGEHNTWHIIAKNLFKYYSPGLIAKTVAASPSILATTETMFTEQKNTGDSSSSATTIGVVIAVIVLFVTIVVTATVVTAIFLRRKKAKCHLNNVSTTVYVLYKKH